MKNSTISTLIFGLFFLFGTGRLMAQVKQPSEKKAMKSDLPLGAFSMSLNVKNLAASQAFYEKLGFTIFGGSHEQHYLIMKNGKALIGLFQGMFQGNILTFNPGWDENAQNLDSFKDIRQLQQHFKQEGLKLLSEADEQTKGPASILLKDPDDNMILIDQHR